ncbi:MAG TPA: alpha-L-fucosidase [Vicinamibacterales bacterium]
MSGTPLRTLRRAAAAAAAAAVLLAAPAPRAQEPAPYTPAPENLKAREWFQEARFGLFVHWGVYSLLGDGEWVLNNQRIRLEEYEKLPAFFNPIAFDPAEWVAMAKAAGMKYITITSKHHDGFAMFDSKVSDWDIVDRTPYGRDVLKALAEECRRQGLKLFFYYSQLDWHHPDYYPRGRTGNDTGRPNAGNWDRYIDYMNAQLTELLTNYGDIGGIWFDGWWDRPDAPWRLDETYALIHRLQPSALIGSNHHRRPFPGEDFQMFEKDLPGHNTAGFNAEAEIGDLPLEMCDTINGSWGFNLQDRRHKSTRDLIHLLVKAAGYDSNFLLNVGPMPNGKIQEEHKQRLAEIGEWLKTHGEAIYGTRGGPVSPRPWGVTTKKGRTVYVHVLDWQDGTLLLPPLGAPVKSARFLKNGQPTTAKNLPEGVLITLPADPIDPYVTIVALELES